MQPICLPHYDNINIIVPREFLSFLGRKRNMNAVINASFSYIDTEHVEVFFIGCTAVQHRNIIWTTSLYKFIDDYVKEYVNGLYNPDVDIEVEIYERSQQ